MQTSITESDMLKALATHFNITEVQVVRQMRAHYGLDTGCAECDYHTFNQHGRAHLTGLQKYYETIFPSEKAVLVM